MLESCKVRLKPGTREEIVPELDETFPCLTDVYGLYPGDMVPWHWHKGIELFYVESGCIEYVAPSERFVFSAGTGGMINSDVPHMAESDQGADAGVQHLHMFDPMLIAGSPGSRIEQRYVLPLTASSQVEMVALLPDCPEHAWALRLLRESFGLDRGAAGYELRLRAVLSELWLEILTIAQPRLTQESKAARGSEQLKQMLVFIHENYGEKITVRQLARIAHVSERLCYSLFHENLHITPMEYVEKHRIRMACRMLMWTREPVSAVGAACGLGGSGHFGQVFRRHTGCTPLQYRKRSANDRSE